MRELASFGVNMPDCRYEVRPCKGTEHGSELVLESRPGVLITEKRELRNPFILPVDSNFVVITAVQ